MLRLRTIVAAIAVTTLLAFVPNPARAGSTSYLVSVNTASLSGQNGYLDFQFNPGGTGASAASATVSAFTTDGSLQPGAPLNGVSGDVSGALPGALVLRNTTGFNDYFDGFTYGNAINFSLTLSGPAVGTSGSVGSAFAFSLYDATGSNPLLTTDPNGSVLTVNVNPDGSTSVETFPQSPTNNSPVASASAVPEPSSLMLFLSTVPAGLALWVRMKRPVDEYRRLAI